EISASFHGNDAGFFDRGRGRRNPRARGHGDFRRATQTAEGLMRLQPKNIQQIGDELAISWNDGTESFFKLEMLRRACPCAGCGGEPDVLGHISRPPVTYTDK